VLVGVAVDVLLEISCHTALTQFSKPCGEASGNLYALKENLLMVVETSAAVLFQFGLVLGGNITSGRKSIKSPHHSSCWWLGKDLLLRRKFVALLPACLPEKKSGRVQQLCR
jgi:hypothetical protein